MRYKLNNKKVWAGKYMGVDFEVNYWPSPDGYPESLPKDNWTHYIFLHLDRIPEQYKPNSFWLKGRKSGRHVFYDYYKHSILGNIEFHGGCTWYSKEHGFDNSERVIKIGCDYQHYWDDGYHYTLEYVLSEVKRTIEDFRNKVSEYKYWCGGNGKLYNLEDGILKDEDFFSTEYYGDKDWFKAFHESPSLLPTTDKK